MKDANHAAEELLVLEAQAGNGRALEALVALYQKRLWLYARHLVGREDAAWDVCQEAWLAVVTGISSLDDPAFFGRWAYRIVSHKCADWLRRQGRREDLWAEVTMQARCEAEAPGRALEFREAWERLEPRARALLTLQHVEGFSIQEIAGILSVPEGTVKSRLHRAKGQLQDLLKESDHELA